MIKFTILLKKRSDFSHEQFIHYHKFNHGPLFKSLPVVKEYVKRYIQCHSTDIALPGLPPPIFDGITELWFDDVEAIGKVFHDEKYMEIIRPDEEKFLDLAGCSFLISTEHQVI